MKTINKIDEINVNEFLNTLKLVDIDIEVKDVNKCPHPRKIGGHYETVNGVNKQLLIFNSSPDFTVYMMLFIDQYYCLKYIKRGKS